MVGDQTIDIVEVKYVADGSDGKLHVRARYNGFEGHGEAWVSPGYVATFAERLSAFPLDSDNPVELSVGIGKGDDYIEFIGLSAFPIGGKGQLVLRVRLASESWLSGRPVAEHQATIEFPTSYELLRRFSGHVRLVLDGRIDSATLDADVLV